MGYTTTFTGCFELDKPLDDQTWKFLVKLANTRRMARKVGPEFGVEGEFYVDAGGLLGQDYDNPNIIDCNRPPATQPGLWCQWRPTVDKRGIEWTGGEKFYRYVEWLAYIIEKILAPRGYVLAGSVHWQGERNDDKGTIIIENNKIITRSG